MENQTQGKSNGVLVTLCVLVAILILVVIYAVSKPSSPEVSSVTDTTDQPAPTIQQTAPQNTESNTTAAKPSSAASSLATASANGLACKNIANAAANVDDAQEKRTDPYGSVSVLQTHYNQSLGNCYYELTIVTNGTIETDLKAAPDDSMLAWCADISSNGQTSTICNEHNHQGLETEQQFKQIEAEYLTN